MKQFHGLLKIIRIFYLIETKTIPGDINNVSSINLKCVFTSENRVLWFGKVKNNCTPKLG